MDFSDLSPTDLASISPLSAEDEAAITPQPSLWGRAGQQLANAPSDIYNDIARLAFNIGLDTGGYGPTQVPKPYDIAPPKTGGEVAVDTLAGIAKSVPLFLTGEGVGLGLGELAGAGKVASGFLKMAGGFGLPGLAESPEMGAEGAALGAASEAASFIPAKYRLPLAGAISAASAIGTYSATGDRVKAGQAALLGIPFMFGRGAKTEAIQEVADKVAPLQLGYTPIARNVDKYERMAKNARLRLMEPVIEAERDVPMNELLPAPKGVNFETTGIPYETQTARLKPPGAIVNPVEFSANRAFTMVENEEGVFVPRDNVEAFQPPRQLQLEAPKTPPPTLPEKVFWNGKWRTMEEAQDDLNRTHAAQQSKKQDIRKNVTTEADINPKRNVMLKTVLHPDDSEMIVKSTNKLDILYDGVQDYEIPGQPLQLKFTDPTHGGTFELPVGSTYKDLKNAKFAKQAEFTANTAKAKVASEQKLHREMAEAAKPEPVATLQLKPAKVEPKAKPVKPKTVKDLKADVGTPNMVGTVPIKIEEREYHIVKQKGKWYDANALSDDDANAGLLATSKQGAVQALKQQHLSLPSSLEDVAAKAGGTTGKVPLKTGDRVSVDFGDGPEPAVVVTSQGEITRVRSIGSGEVLDKYTHQVSRGSTSKDVFVNKEPEQQYGTIEDLHNLEEQNQAKSRFGGKRMRGEGRASESGAIPTDVALAISRYVAIPLAGAAIGYAMDEPDKRMRGAILGLAAGYGLTIGGPRLLKLLAEANPNVSKAGSVAAGVKEAVDATFKAVKGDAEMAAKVQRGRKTTGFDRMARWMEQNLHTNIDVTRVFGRTNDIELLGETLHKTLTSLSQNKFTPDQNVVILDYLFGKTGKAQLDRAIGKELGNQVSAAGEIRTALQKITTAGMQDSKLKTTIEKSYDEYLTTTYKFFTDPKYFPSDEAVFNAAKEMDASFGSVENRMDIMFDWLHKIQANRKQFKMAGGFGESLGSLLARKNQDLSPALKEMLGIYDDPIQRLAVTGTKLVQAARSAKFFDEVSKGIKQNGLKMVYTGEEKDATRAALTHQLETLKRNVPKTPDELLAHTKEVATLQSKILDLQNYAWNENNPSFGKLGGKFIDRRVRDSLNTFDAVHTHFQSPMARSILKWTNRIKYGKILLSPLQFSRQVVTFPLLGIMAKTGPMDWARAYQTLFYNPAERARLTKIGVIWGDQVHGMLRKDLEAMMEGRLDDLIQNSLLKKGLHKWEETFRTPDLLNRISAFQKEENRLLRMGTEAKAAEDMAINYANRYTMNYAAVPPGIQKARQIPFLNQYLTFAYEAARIAKNIGEDAIVHKDPAAMAILTTMATAPFLIQKASEALLSDKDREDWKRLESLQQDYRRGNYNIVTGRDEKGNFHFINFTPIIVHDSWMKMAKDIIHLDGKAFMADNPIFGWDNTPLLNVASNVMTGTDLHTKQPLHSFADQFHAARKEVAPPLLGTDLDRFVQALTPNNEGGLGITDSRTGNSVTIAGMLASYLTSIRAYSSNLPNMQLGEISNVKQEVQDMHSQLMKVLRTNISQPVKDEAIQRYQQRVRQMFLELQTKVGDTTEDQLGSQPSS